MHSLELHDLIIDCCRPTIFKEEDELYRLMEVGDAVFILLIVWSKRRRRTAIKACIHCLELHD